MLPHNTIQRAGGSIQSWQSLSRPRHGVGDASFPQSVELALVAVSQAVAQLNEVAVVATVAASTGCRLPVAVQRPNLPRNAADANPFEVGREASQISVSAIDVPPFGRGRGQQGPVLRHSAREFNRLLCGQVVKVSAECLELGHDPEDVGMGDRTANLERTSRAFDLPHRDMRGRKRVDGLPSRSMPPLERKRFVVAHGTKSTRPARSWSLWCRESLLR